MIILLPILLTALLHRLRGWGPTDSYETDYKNPPKWRVFCKVVTSKIAAIPLMLGGVWWAASGDWVIGLIVAAGYQLYVIPGWGDYWDGSNKKNQEINFIDRLFEDFEPGVLVDVLSMSLRALFILPLFFALGFYFNSLIPVALGHLMVLQGVIYAGFRVLGLWHVPAAEIVCGFLIGALLAFSTGL